MTFFEYVTRRLLGEPAGGTPRDPYWECPACGRVKLHCRPPSDYKDRVACWVCGFHDDAEGLWKLKNPGRYFRDAQAAIAEWRKEWEQVEQAARKTAAPTSAPSIPSRGVASGGAEKRDHPLAVGAAWADLWECEREVLLAAWAVMNGLRRSHPDVSLTALAQYCHDFRESMWRLAQAHLRECDDPDCDAPVCRAAWGEANQRALMDNFRGGGASCPLVPEPGRNLASDSGPHRQHRRCLDATAAAVSRATGGSSGATADGISAWSAGGAGDS
jgi:hypothetical protein